MQAPPQCRGPSIRHGDFTSSYRIAVVIGSLRQDSFNKKLAQALVQLAPKDFSFDTLRIDDLPTLGQPETFVQNKEGLFDAAGGIGSERTKKFLQGWMGRYVAWVKSHNG